VLNRLYIRSMDHMALKMRHNESLVRFLPIILGLLISQVVATALVYRSNLHVLTGVTTAQKAGYLAIPAGPVTASLNSFNAAFWGGLFFTLSVGVGLTVATWAAIYLWQRILLRRRLFLASCTLAWGSLLVAVNWKGMALFPSLFCLLVPLGTAWTAVAVLPVSQGKRNRQWIVPLATFILITVLWTTQLNGDLFITIRDQILLSNPIGRSVNEFYYRYTLYAAEAFKSFQQKTLHTCHLEGLGAAPAARRWEAFLAHYDLLVLPQIQRPDVCIRFSGETLRLISALGRGIALPVSRFESDPVRALRAFSKATDRFGSFRRITLIGLLIGFPTLLFVAVYAALHWLAQKMFDGRRATVLSSGLCLVVGILLYLPLLKGGAINTITPEKIPAALKADDWTIRVAAIRYIETHKLEIANYPAYQRLLDSPLVVERYWLARAMANSRSEQTYPQLLRLMQDPNPNVTCQAFYALGKRGQRTAIAPIKACLMASNNWYSQWYGYRAMRSLGWHQGRSN
jgi:HEAT repeats